MKKAGLWTLILGILLFVAVVFIVVYNVILPGVADRQTAFYQAGAQYGYEQAIYQIAQQSISCNSVPLNIENQTIELIAVDCLTSA